MKCKGGRKEKNAERYRLEAGRESRGSGGPRNGISPVLRPLVSLPSVRPTPLDPKCPYLPGERRFYLDKCLLAMPVDASKMG